ncbi:MAG TPA: hypothetical protein VEP49_22055 [Acidimicrobiia bacterium]|nr:hypothetical protein [Acidimicrobiia bacterium]
MAMMRFNHMELTLPKGTITDDFRADLESFYGGVFGWTIKPTKVLDLDATLLLPDDGQFILIAEATKHLDSPGLDHLGLLMDTRDEVDEMLGRCQRYREKDERCRIHEFNDLVSFGGDLVTHAFYVKYLLPIFFDVQVLERKPGTGPAKRWAYG